MSRKRGGRRKRSSEPLWPLLVVLGLAGGGVGVGILLVDEPLGTMPAGSPESLDPGEVPSVRERVRVEVLNAGGVAGMAGAAREELRAAGFDVVHFGNAAAFGRDTSVVLVRTEMYGAGARAARALGIERVETAPDSTVFADLTVLLGADWGGGEGWKMEESVDEAPWWDLRRLLRND